MRTLIGAVPLVAAALGFAPPQAGAGNLGTNGCPSYCPRLEYSGDGAVNTVSVGLVGASATFADATSAIVLRPGAECALTDPNHAACTARRGFEILSVGLLGGDDTFTAAGSLVPAPGGSSMLSGGAGNDTITGTDGPDRLVGGDFEFVTPVGGVDALDGSAGDDVLSDADPAGARDADRLDGGPGADTVSYVTRTDPVTIDLAVDRSGAPGENDVLANVENAEGGRGDDTIVGDAGPNVVFGGGGSGTDTITTGAGNDTVTGFSGRDVISTGPGADVVEESEATAPHRIACGPGRDVVRFPRAQASALAADCETVALTRSNDFVSTALSLEAKPAAVTATSVSFAFRCAASASSAKLCTGTLRLSRSGGGRAATTKVKVPVGGRARVVVPLKAKDAAAIGGKGLEAALRFTSPVQTRFVRWTAVLRR